MHWRSWEREGYIIYMSVFLDCDTTIPILSHLCFPPVNCGVLFSDMHFESAVHEMRAELEVDSAHGTHVRRYSMLGQFGSIGLIPSSITSLIDRSSFWSA